MRKLRPQIIGNGFDLKTRHVRKQRHLGIQWALMPLDYVGKRLEIQLGIVYGGWYALKKIPASAITVTGGAMPVIEFLTRGEHGIIADLGGFAGAQ